MPVEKLILFRINNQMYGINVDYVSAIESVTDIVRVPNAPSNIEGIINLRGNVIPVYSLHKKFNTVLDTATQESQMIITRSKNDVFSFMVDQVDEIYVVENGQYINPPDVLMCEKTSYIAGIVKIEERLVLCVDVDELMSETEKENMQSFVKQMSNNE